MSVLADRRNVGLDILRAAAISMVFLYHGISLGRVPLLGQFETGVDLFFVLSGFLIGRIYFRSLQNNSFTFAGFWSARWWRTLPPYFAAFALYLFLRHVPSSIPGPSLPWYYLVFLQNYAGITGWAPTWSLCVEEHFYLILPLAATMADRVLGRACFRWVIPSLFFLPLVCRLSLLAAGGLPPAWFWMTHLHCDGLFAGLWLAYVAVERPGQFRRLQKISPWLVPIAPLALLYYSIVPAAPALDVLLFTIVAIGYGAWLCFCYGLTWEPKSRTGRAVRFTVRHLALGAYSIYLTDTTVNPVLREFAEATLHLQRGPLRTAFVLVASLAVAAVLYLLVERPSIVTRNLYLNHQKPALEPDVVTTAA